MVATGFSLADLIDPSSIMPATVVIADSTLIFAIYAAARTMPLAVLAIWSVVKRNWKEIIILAILVGVMQFPDGFIGIYQHNIGKTFGPSALALLQFKALMIA